MERSETSIYFHFLRSFRPTKRLGGDVTCQYQEDPVQMEGGGALRKAVRVPQLVIVRFPHSAHVWHSCLKSTTQLRLLNVSYKSDADEWYLGKKSV